MNCPACGTATSTRFCPNCGAEVSAEAGATVWSQPPPQSQSQWQGAAPAAPVRTAVTTAEARNWAMGAHIAALAGLIVPFGNLIGPLVVWLVKRDESALVDREGKESLNFQISMTIYMFVSALLILVLIGLPLLFVVAIVDLVLTIVAASKASNGVPYRYPMTIRFLS
jgi:uncharacterized Tic20 family protein